MRFLMGFLVFLLAANCVCWSQATLNVPSASYPTIQSAINAAAQGDRVLVGAGTFVENLVFPSKDFHLLGAGPNQTVIDGNLTGSCLQFTQPVSNAMVVEGFKLTNGLGTPTNGPSPVPGGLVPSGGAIFISIGGNTVGPQISPIFKNCVIAQNVSSVQGGGVFIRFGGNVVFEDCLFDGNQTAGGHGAAVSGEFGKTALIFKGCTFVNHSGSGETVFLRGCSLRAVGCRFENNTAANRSGISYTDAGANMPPFCEIRGCSFIGNINSSLGVPTFLTNGIVLSVDIQAPAIIENCLFARNVAGTFVAGFLGITPSVRNCTFADNQLSSNMAVVLAVSTYLFMGTTRVENCIFAGNVVTGGIISPPVVSSYPLNYTEIGSIIEDPTNVATFVAPDFIDPLNNDYHLKPGSVGIDGGTWAGLVPYPGLPDDAVDLDGNPRVRMTEVDAGCYEAQHVAYHPAMNGRVGETSGGPFDVLQVNGSAGDIFRTVTVPLGTASTLTMLQPSNVANPASFAIFGMVGEAQFELVTTVPLGIGEMIFPPCPLLPFIPDLFTLTNNFGPSCAQVVGSTPTPWTSIQFPPIGFPITLTFQGIIEESPGVYVPTNGVIYRAE